MTPSAIRIRRLEINDKSKGFIELLQQLSICDSVSDNDFEERFQELSRCGDDHVICVIEDLESGKIVGTGSVFIEKKFLRNCGKVGHIEDVVVDGNTRGMQLGKRVVEFLTEHARSVGCYKVILDCSDENVLFYDKCGFRRKEVQMAKYFLRAVVDCKSDFSSSFFNLELYLGYGDHMCCCIISTMDHNSMLHNFCYFWPIELWYSVYLPTLY